MVQDVHQSPVKPPLRRVKPHAEHDVAHLRDARVGEHSLQVGLRYRDDRAYNYRDRSDPAECSINRDINLEEFRGEDREEDADEGVNRDLRHRRRNYHADRRGGVGVGVGLPNMQREERHFYARSHDEEDERRLHYLVLVERWKEQCEVVHI